MVRKYKRKTKKTSEILIEQALSEIKEGRPVQQMALKYGVGRNLLRSRLMAMRPPHEIELIKQKRDLKAPYRKWTEQEERQLVNFLRDNMPIEKPTAQTYYKRFLHQIGEEMQWSLVRSKTKNMRQSYYKAVAWQNSKAANDPSWLQCGKNKNDLLLRMCPFFDELEEIFGAVQISLIKRSLSDTEETTADSPMAYPVYMSASTLNMAESSNLEENATSSEKQFNSETHFQEDESSHTDGVQILGVYSGFTEFKKKKLNRDFKIKKLNRDFKIKKMKLLLKQKEYDLKNAQFLYEKEKSTRELTIKEAEIESQQKFRILELEMKERIALKELEMKERIEMEKLKVQK